MFLCPAAHVGLAQEKADDNLTIAETPPPAISESALPTGSTWLHKIESILKPIGINADAIKLYATWLIGAPILVIAVILLLFFRPLRRNTVKPSAPPLPAAALQTQSTIVRAKRAPTPVSAETMNGLSDKQRVLRFFFQLYKNQIGADPNAPNEMFLVETRPSCPNETYEMRIMQEGEWTTRRMSIGLLGQGGGSRSKCFYVIYDTHMVVKIPSVPVTGFTAYNRQIGSENAIVARLVPRKCIVPRVSVILKNILTLPETDNLSAEVIEKKYKHLLEVNPFLQEYLKIGSTFAFFMDLAKHFFLSSTLEEIHRGHINLAEEALQHPELVWDQHGFACRYGEESSSVCNQMQEIYCRAERELLGVIQSAPIAEDVPVFQLKRWFLIHLAGERVDARKEDLSTDLIEKANQCLANIVKQHQPQVKSYREVLRRYILETRFSRYQPMLESLSSNTLDLLAWIETKGLALRDLKPENLFVAGNPDEYPYFLNSAKNFSIGLIDVETAVMLNSAKPEQITQPQLAGTPLYATPSHLLTNSVLLDVYKDLRTALHLQDWFATIAIIFKIFTGRNLFVATARVFPEIISRLKLLDPSGPDLHKDVAEINRIFWNSATAEFQEALTKHEPNLSRVEVAVPPQFIPEIVKALHRDSDRISHAIRYAVANQTIFSSEEKRRFLMDASADKIDQMNHRLKHEPVERGKKTNQHGDALQFFQQLARLKRLYERKMEASAALKSTNSPIAADQLLEAMFQRVFNFMYFSSWPALTPSKWRGMENLPDDDIATYQATM